MNGEESPPKLSRRRAIGYGEFCTPIRMPRPGAWGASLSGHPLFQSREAFLGGLLNEGHIFSKVLLGVDFAFLAPFLLVQSELRDHGTMVEAKNDGPSLGELVILRMVGPNLKSVLGRLPVPSILKLPPTILMPSASMSMGIC